MNKIYKVCKNNNFCFKLNFATIKITLVLIVMTFGSGYINAQVTVNPGAFPYTNLGAAFTAINAGTHTGALTIDINGTSTETAMAVLNSSGTGSANYSSILIRPVSATATITGSLPNSIIKLYGADNVTIDGLNGANQLTIRNTFTSTGAAIIWLGSASTSDGANNNTVRNCIITGNTGTTTFIGIVISSGITIGGLAEALNSNNTLANNTLTASRYGIALVGGGGVVGNDNGNVISGNSIGSIVATSKMSQSSIFVAQQQNFSVSQNTIFGNSSALTTPANNGILITGGISGGIVEKNTISDIKKSGVWGCSGIQLNASNTASNLTVSNNFIFDIAAGGFAGTAIDDNGYGIAVSAGGGYNIWHNSVNLNTNQPTSVGTTAALWIGAGVTTGGAINLRNNIFANTQTNSTRYAVFSSQPSSVFSTIDNNDYYSTGSVGFLGAAQATLAAWQTVTFQDLNSVAVDPTFFAPNNLHLFFTSPLNGLATPIGAINRDIDGDIRDAVTPDIGADEFTPGLCSVSGGNNGGTATATNLNICATGSTTLSATGYGYGIGISYQWEFFNGAIWVPLVGQTNPFSAVLGSISATTQYRLAVTCASCCGGLPGYSNVVTITVNNPTVSGTTPASRCGVGTVNLAATAAGTLNWYAAPTGGTSLFTGSPFTTPVISATTNFYVSSSVPGSTIAVGKPSTAGADGGYTLTDAGLVFTATSPFQLQSVRMYPQGASNVTIQALTSAGALIPGCTATAIFTGPVVGGVVVPLPGFVIPVGVDHRLVVTINSSSIAIWRDFTGNSFPYTIGSSGSITSGWIGGTSTAHYFFYDWQITEICEGLRTPVTATITAPPAFTSVSPAAGAPRTICAGSSVTLNAVGGGYSSYTWNPGSIPNNTSITPTITTSYTITATDGTCRRDSAITITVNPAPTAITVNPPAATSCSATIIPITATGGILVGQTIFSENFESFPLTQFAVTGTGVTAAANTTYYQQGLQSVHLTAGNSIDGQLAMANSVNLSSYTNPKLSFYQISALEPGFDTSFIQYSTDGGTNWNTFPASSYAGAGTLLNGFVTFDKTSYADWNTQFTSAASTPGAGPATALWKLETINLSTWASATNFKVRFRFTTDNSVLYYGWLIDNVIINGDGQAPITWSPITELFSNAACTIPYIAGTPALNVWTQPTVSHTYQATATGGVGCNQTANSVITVTGTTPPTVTISAVGGTTICQGDCKTFTATVVNGGGNPGYKWFVNGVQVNLPLIFNSNPGQNPYTICGLNNGDVVTCQILSNAGGCAIPNPSPVSAGITMTVNPKPTVSIDGLLTRCFPSILTVTTTGTITGYEWFLGAAPVGILSTYNATVPGTYTCIVTTNLGCKDTSVVVLTGQTYTITSTSGPNGTITPLGVTTLDCGDNQTFTITPNAGGYSICDVIVDGISVGTPATYTFSNVTANHTIDVTFCLTGCPNPPTANAGANDSFCANATYTLAGTIGGSGTAGTWTGGTGTFNPNNTTLNAIYTPSAAEILAGTVTLTLTSNNPLGGFCIPSVSTVTLTIKPVPAVTVSGLLGVCSGPATTTTLTASATIASGTISGYQWFNSVPTQIGALASQLLSVTGNYSVTVNASNGCSTNSPLTIVAFTNPSTPTITGSNTICVGTSSALVANVAAPGNGGATIPASGYQWYNPGSIVGATNATYSAAAAATYTVTVTNSNGCLSAASAGFAVALDNSPLNGAYTIGVGPASCTNYLSFATAINDLNLRAISGDVRFDIPAGYTETVPVLGLRLGSVALNASVAGRSITFKKSGVGANPLLNAYSGGLGVPSGLVPDGIWSLNGVDNVVIDAIDLSDGNLTNNATMDYGFGLFKLNTGDGAQNNLIQNCTITLKRINDGAGASVMPDGSTGIVVVNSLCTNANTALVPVSAAGTNSNNKFYSNIIQNCTTGIGLMGYSAASPFTLGDTGNDIGGIVAGTGNSILNFGGASPSTATAVGIRINHQWGLNVSNNTINNNNGGGANHLSILRGIWGQTGLSASVTINNNIITLNSNATTQQCTAIENAIGSTPAGNTVTISNNTVTGSYLTATSGGLTGIINGATPANITINGNVVQNFSLPGSGPYIGISNNGAATSINMNNNSLLNCTIGTGTITGISNTVAGATNLTLSNNIISGITKGATAAVNWMQTSTSTNAIVNDNVITNNTVAAGAANITVNCILGGTSLYQVDNNFIFNNSITGVSAAFTASLNGYNNIGSSTQNTISNNTIRKLFVTGTSTGLITVQGINSIANAAGTQTINNNTIGNIYCSSVLLSSVYGIRTSAGATVNIFRNKVDSLFPGAGATSIAAGIRAQNAVVNNIYNNFINLDLTQATAPAANAVLTAADALKGFEITASAVGNTVNLYYNTIRLAGSGNGANFGSSGISIFSATPTVNLRNNIIVNLTTPGATGFAVAYRRPVAALATYASTSNNNLFYAGVPSANRLLYYDITNSYQTLNAYQLGTGIAPRESNSVSTLPNFVSVTDLHLIPGSNCSTDGAAAPIVGYSNDFDTDPRDVLTPDIGADEFTGTGVGVGVWKGVNTNWNDILNWCDAIPDAKTNVTIPAAVANYPDITTATPVANNISIAAGGSVTITGAGKLSIYGTIANAGTFNVVDGTIEMAGSTAQTIPAAAFQNNDIKNLVISNSAASPGVTLGGALNLYGKLSFGGSNRTFTTAGNLVLKSNAAGTASVGDITNAGANTGNAITGDVSVERFITARRAWRFLSVPTQNNLQTIKQAWQENMPANSNTQTTPAGYGIHITKDSANWAAYGFDLQTTPGPSMKTYVAATNAWKGITSTVDVPGVNNGRFVTGTGYMVLVRGDRTVNTFPSAATVTTLRDKGALLTGTYGPVAVGAGQFAAIGNPYASAVNFASASLTKTNLQDVYYLWDPYLGSLGGYVTFAGPTYNPTANISYPTNKFIESGQAFFVRSSGPAGSLTFNEASKVDGSYLVTRLPGTDSRLRTNLYLVDTAGRHLYDGTVAEFESSYANEADEHDAEKLTNFGENLGIKLGDKLLSVERRTAFVESDTVFYNLEQVRARTYQLEFVAEHIAPTGLAAFLEDTYLNTQTPVSLTGTTVVDFSVINEPGSYAADRFRLVFRQAAPVPVTFTSIRATKQDRNSIMVEWKVENELNIHHYELERSADGRNFSKVNEQAARGTGSGAALVYNWLDTNPLEGDNFYRVRSVGISNDNKLSQVVKVNMGKLPSEITVFPNPVNEDGVVYISLSNKPAGNYQLSLVNSKGQVMQKKVLNHAGGSSVYSITMEKYMSHGNYMLNISGDDNIKLTFKVVY